MELLKKYGFYFLLLGVISDFLTPYGLGIFYPELNQMTAVISLFGDTTSPVRRAFLVWSVISGVLMVLSLPAVYQTFKKTSPLLAKLATLSIAAYGIGDCIFTGLFSVTADQSSWNFATWVHNIGSGLGYAGFLILPLFLILLSQKQGRKKQSQLYLILFLLSILFSVVYGLARIPALHKLPLFSQLGLWQRVSFFFNYLSWVVLALSQLKKHSKSVVFPD